MRVCIVTDVIDFEKEKTGVTNYTKYLVQNISQLSHNNTIYLMHYKQNVGRLYQRANEIVSPPIPIPAVGEIFTNVLIRPFLLKGNDINVVHMPSPTTLGNLLFLMPGFKKVLTVHDLYNFFPQFRANIHSHPVEWLGHRLWKPSLQLIRRNVDKYIADSENTKKDLIRFLKVPEKKVKVIYLAPDEMFKQADYSIPDYIGSPFILSNDIHSVIVRVFHELRRKGIKHKLAIFGGSRKINRPFEIGLWGFIKELGLENDIVILGYVSDEELVRLYNTADIYVRPTWYEGFGLPPVEAMACGCPVVVSGVGSLPEVVGNAGILVNSVENIDGWVDAIYSILTDDKSRTRMIKDGLEQAGKFSWKRTAEETIRVYEEVHNS